MTSRFKETIIISVGGSLLIPDAIDVDFMHKLKDMVKHFVDQGYQMLLVVGGGKTCRRYQNAAATFEHINNTDLDWIGIKTIHLNCELLRRVLNDTDIDVHNQVILRPQDIKDVDNSVVVIGAWEPGCSSDNDAVEIGHILGAQRIINFSNTAYVYNGDPRLNPEAEKFESLSWDAYRDLIPDEWTAGLSAPFDPVASKAAQNAGMTVAVLGASIENLENYLENREFKGTIIS